MWLKDTAAGLGLLVLLVAALFITDVAQMTYDARVRDQRISQLDLSKGH